MRSRFRILMFKHIRVTEFEQLRAILQEGFCLNNLQTPFMTLMEGHPFCIYSFLLCLTIWKKPWTQRPWEQLDRMLHWEAFVKSGSNFNRIMHLLVKLTVDSFIYNQLLLVVLIVFQIPVHVKQQTWIRNKVMKQTGK